jgi:hypothetical protein
MLDFLAGVSFAMHVAVALFFVRFWRQTRDGLFLAFGAAFLLLGLIYGISGLYELERETQNWVYLLRLIAFLLIIAALVRKNLAGRRA